MFQRLCQQQEQKQGLELQQEQEQEAGPTEKASLHREEPGPAVKLGRLASLDALGRRRRRADAGGKSMRSHSEDGSPAKGKEQASPKGADIWGLLEEGARGSLAALAASPSRC